MRLLLAILLVLLLVPSYSGEPRRNQWDERARIWAERVPLYPDTPERTQLGALDYLGGIRLRSDDPAFGGFSAMSVVGDRFTLLSDDGNLLRFRLRDDWRLEDAHVSVLPAGPRTGWRKMDRDSESLARDPVTGKFWVGFEVVNQIWRYAPDFSRWERMSAPPAMRSWFEGSGAEAMTRLADSGFLVLAEGTTGACRRGKPALRFAGDPTEQPKEAFRFCFVPPPGFSPTDVAELPDGRLLVLTRRARLSDRFTAKLVLVERGAIQAGAVVEGREIANFAAPAQHDNFEALVVTRERGQTIVWIASDDNQQFFEQSLLLKFRLNLARLDAGARR